MSAAENLPPRILQRVAREVMELQKSPPDGIRLTMTNGNNLGEITAEICGPEETPYFGHDFELKLSLPSDFPASPPRGFFLTKIYHPNVEWKTGAICVNTLKRDWKSESITLGHVLSVIRCLLIIPFPESSLNDEAGKFFMDSYDEFAKRAKLMANVHAKKSVSGGGKAIEESSQLKENKPEQCDGMSASTKKKVKKISTTEKKIKKKKGLKRL
mmetsp:Transcript_17903/g.23170  ORF Transcript_17903/g.23170 Transcript_17903/m.23170 type:complete len:214 (+) Transcript_17903:275-916(+)|eukprot:CAMPEP_0116057454 /NCGR_PEP_ID=MMETSP0322-20121206/4616_1 /TAXON_ID=163516 /ORGANISM="Leptocylindrus danicus var. apora, Strain B651" /LENGTH=213 /DNA_ID=CAMNT_0003541459 /DNA_START=245 /DNA_END=886 /DNA_ORIENTATION=+